MQKNSFFYDGVIPASKSHFNRALICASYDPQVRIHGESKSDDVIKMQDAVAALRLGQTTFDCGSAGAVLRFFALRVSREPGTFKLTGSKRLFSRPHDELFSIFEQLGIKLKIEPDHLIIESQGWKPKNNTVKVDRNISSQFISAVLLNSWNLDFDFNIEWDNTGVSEGYWKMSAQVVKDFGMTLFESPQGVSVTARSQVKIKDYTVESDLSSAFAIAAYAAINGEANFRQFPFHSLQPDKAFVDILKQMNVRVETSADTLVVRKNPTQKLRGINYNLVDCPDLFPVLATLCAFAETPSKLFGAHHLVFKESNRIQKSAELLNFIGVETKILPDGLEIFPKAATVQPFDFDTDHDHRLAFAAALVKSQNYPIHILDPQVVSKSFPEFWDIIDSKK